MISKTPSKSMSLMLPLFALVWTSCRTPDSSPNSDEVVADQPQRIPAALPSSALGNAWGGNDAAKWKPEAVYANAVSDFINRLWTMQSVADVLVSIPVIFQDNDVVRPYGDGQSNARVTFSSSWAHKSVPLRTGLVRNQSGASVIILEFSPDLNLVQDHIEISYKGDQGEVRTATIDAQTDANGWLTASWTALPEDLPWSKVVDAANADVDSVSGYTFFVRPTPGFDDWFPVTFKHPWSTAAKITATVPANLNSFKAGSEVPAPDNLSDPLNFAQKTEQDPLPFDLAYDMGMQKTWPKAFFPSDRPYFPACNVHGNFKKMDRPEDPDSNQYDPTAVGRNWTWVADPNARYPGNDLYPGAATVPFKILYTCFEERRLKQPTGNDSDCGGLSRSSEEEAGVPSGGGWHKIGDPAETLFNSVERVPLLVSAGFERPSERVATMPPSGTYAYGLSDVAVARWLWPGEAFLTANSAKDSNGNEAKNFHWFLFHADREVCTVEWVHPTRPDDSRTVQF